MTARCKEKIQNSIADFHLPRYDEIPTVGLYLEQVTRYISDYLAPLQGECITNSMVSNYVKKHLIANPVKKQYGREQIAYLIFIAVIKNVMSLEHIRQFIALQQQTYDSKKAYDYFCDELENVLGYVFGFHLEPVVVGEDSTDEKVMLRNAIIAVCNKIYLEKCFQVLSEEAKTAP